MFISATENAAEFIVRQGTEVISLFNRSGYIDIDRGQLLELLAATREWAETGESTE